MKTEMMVLERLRDMIIAHIGEHFSADEGGADLTPFDDKSVVIDFPDVDNMRKDSMFYIEPDYENFEALSLMADQATMNVTVTILVKGAPHTTLIKRVFGYFTALCSLLASDRELNGFVDYTEVTDMDYYPYVTAGKSQSAIEATLRIRWDRIF